MPVTCETIYARLGLPDTPLLVDAREESAFLSQPLLVPGAIRILPGELPQRLQGVATDQPVVLYCSDGAGGSEALASKLSATGRRAAHLEGGILRWVGAKLPTVRVSAECNVPGISRWVTRERPKIDRLACPWLVRRFIDPQAQFFYVPAHLVRSEAQALGAQPYDIADVQFSHRGRRCSFDAFLEDFGLSDPVLDEVANIVRAADTGELADAPQAPGLLAISLGLSANIRDDVLLLEQAMPLYDALYAWRKVAREETHSWPAKVS